MSLSLGAHITKTLEAQYPELTVIITLTTQGSDSFVFTGGAFIDQPASGAAIDYIHNIHAVTPISPKLDPLTRQVQTGAVTVTFVDDGTIRELLRDSGSGTDATHLKHATMEIVFASKYDLSATAPYWKGLVDDVLPRDGVIDLIGKDAIRYADGLRYYGNWMNKHPLELITDLLDAADVQSAFIDSTSMDPDTDTDISHFIAANFFWPGSFAYGQVASQLGEEYAEGTGSSMTPRAFVYSNDDNSGKKGLKIRESIEQIALMMYGSVWADEQGKIKFKRFDSTESAVDTWTSDDILDIKQVSTYKNMVNEVLVALGSGEKEMGYRHRDTDAQARYKMPGGTGCIWQIAIKLPFAAQLLPMEDDVTAVQTAGITVRGLDTSGTCGTRVQDKFRETTSTFASLSPFSQDSAAQLSSSRKLYILWGGEVLTATGLTFANTEWKLKDTDAYGAAPSPQTYSYVPTNFDLTGVTRGVEGSAAIHYGSSNANPTGCFDITIPRMFAQTIVARAANGIPEIEVETSLAKYSTQIGDLVEIDDEFPIMWAHNGITAADNVKFEVVGKEADVLNDPTRIRWRLAVAAVESPPWGTPSTSSAPVDPVYGAGHVGPPGAEVVADDTTSLTGESWTQLEFGDLLRESGSGWDASQNQYIVEVTGTYAVCAACTIEGLDELETAKIAMFVDGSLEKVGTQYTNPTGSAVDAAISLFWTGLLAKGSAVDIRVWVSVSATASADPSETYFSIDLLKT